MGKEHHRTNWFTRLIEFFRSRRARPWKGAILCDPSGMKRKITYENGEEFIVVTEWSKVTTVSAFKRDLFAYDLICFNFKTAEGSLQVDEEMENFDTLIDALPTYLPGALSKAEWWGIVVNPAFTTNWTTLYTAR